MKVIKKRKTAAQAVTLAKINTKLDHIHRDLEQNTKDIAALKEQMAMGKGGLKVIAYMGGILAGIIALIKFVKQCISLCMRDTKTLESFAKKVEKKLKEMKVFRYARKEVETGANGTQKYIIKKGVNKGKVV